MKLITSTVSYPVPTWNFCNVDRFDINAKVSSQTCQFCVKTRTGYTCALYDCSLSVNDRLISKTHDCCMATAGAASSIDLTPAPAVSPKEIIKMAISEYTKQIKELQAQGYPWAMAEQLARKNITGG